MTETAELIAALQEENERLAVRLQKLEARLEITHEFHSDPNDPNGFIRVEIPPELRENEIDGIECRDATIDLCRQNCGALKSANERLREALKPFADAFDSEALGVGYAIQRRAVKAEDCARARSALSQEKGE
jgi:hypothetical protein